MKLPRLHRLPLHLFVLFLATHSAMAQTTVFTYQGQLLDSSQPANGSYDLAFSLYNAASGGTQIGSSLTNLATGVTNGLFTVPLDFGAGPFTGQPLWLKIAVSPAGANALVTLSPLQPLTSAPYAVRSLNAGTAANVTGSISLAQLPPSVVTNGATNVSISGSFSGNGAGVTNLNSANLTGAISDALLSTNVAFLRGSNSLPFTVAQSPGVGNGPFFLTAADINGDGKVDLICANLNDNTLTVLTNNGKGQFIVAQSPGVGIQPKSVTAADVNGDNKMDLICANENDNTLTVLTNNGSGQFTVAQTPSVGLAPAFVTAADVNGDGKMDLICANESDNTLTVLTNNGSGQFTVTQSPGVGLTPTSVVAADVNGDNKIDLICGNLSDNTLTVLTNNGIGQFTVAQTPSVGLAPFSVAAEDVNGDGKIDLICANDNANTLTVLTNNGKGRFTVAQSPSVGHEPTGVTAVDVNGDGKVDLICGNGSDNTLTVLTNDGKGRFTVAQSPSVGLGPICVTAADVNGDGKVDLVCANLNDNTLTVLLGNGPTETFTSPTIIMNASSVFTGNGGGLTNLSASALSQPVAFTNTVSFKGLTVFNDDIATAFGIYNNSGTALAELAVAAGAGQFSTSAGLNDVVLRASQGGQQKLLLQSGSGAANITISNGVTTVFGTFNNNSDRNAKKDFVPVSPTAILDKVADLPLSEWSYKEDAGTRHLGPMAQDFYAAFNVGTDDRHIAPIDEGGVALAAIKGLNQKLEQQLKQKDSEIQDLKQRLDALEKLVHAEPPAKQENRSSAALPLQMDAQHVSSEHHEENDHQHSDIQLRHPAAK